MPGRERLQKIQIGKEVTAGTAVAATTIWRGMGKMLDDQRTVEEIEELIGVLDGADRTAITLLKGGLELSEIAATPEQAAYFGVMAFGMSPTGAADGAGTDKIYTCTIPTTTAPTVNNCAYTVQAGDDFEAERMEYALCTKFVLSGKAGETVKMSGSLVGRNIATNAFTGALAIPVVSELVTSKGKVYLDAIGGVYGTTQVSNAILAFTATYEIMWAIKPTLSGNLYWDFAAYAGHKVTTELTYEHDTAVSGSGGAKEFMRLQTPKKLRIDLIGDAPTSAGTTYSNKRIIIDQPLKFSKIGVLESQDGNDIVKMTARSRYNTTAGDQGKLIFVNELATLP